MFVLGIDCVYMCVCEGVRQRERGSKGISEPDIDRNRGYDKEVKGGRGWARE